jgi:hypothetical protein
LDLPVENLGYTLYWSWFNTTDHWSIESFRFSGNIIGDVIIYKGQDVEPPAQVVVTREEPSGGNLLLEWQPSSDNVLTAFYEVLAIDTNAKLITHISYEHDLSASVPLSSVTGKLVKVRAWDIDSNGSDIGWSTTRTERSGQAAVRESIELLCSPNPSNSGIAFKIHGLEMEGVSSLCIYDVKGRLVAALNGISGKGALWDGKSKNGINAAAGMYAARLVYNGRVLEKRFVITR